MLIFASFWDRFLNVFWIVLGSTLRALGYQNVIKKRCEIFQKVDKIGPSVPQRRPKSVQWGYSSPPRGSEKQVAKKTRLRTKEPCKCFQNMNKMLKVLRIWGNIFRCIFASFCCFLKGGVDHLGINFRIVCMFWGDLFENRFGAI